MICDGIDGWDRGRNRGWDRGWDRGDIDRGLEEFVAVFAETFGFVHGGIGLVEEGFQGTAAGFLAVGGVDADADAGRDRHNSAVKDEALVEGLEDFFGDAAHVLKAGDGGEDGNEFIAAETGDDIAVAEAVGEALGDRFEQEVADLVTVDVVDLFEAVEVDEEEGDLMVLLVGAIESLLKLLVEAFAVGQVGEGVVVGDVGEEVFRLGEFGVGADKFIGGAAKGSFHLLALGDVADYADEEEVPGGVAVERSLGGDEVGFALSVGEFFFALLLDAAVEGEFVLLPEVGCLAGREKVVVHFVDQGGVGVADEVAVGWVEDDPLVALIFDVDGIGDGVDDGTEEFFGFFEFFAQVGEVGGNAGGREDEGEQGRDKGKPPAQGKCQGAESVESDSGDQDADGGFVGAADFPTQECAEG